MDQRRLIWPWALGVALLVAGSVFVFVASFVASGLLAVASNARAEGAVRQAVLAFDAAYENQDCDAFQALVDDDLADQLVDDEFDCDAWIETAKSLQRDGEYDYTVDVLDVHVDGNDASAYTEENAGEQGPTNYYYTLERASTGWVIVAYDRR